MVNMLDAMVKLESAHDYFGKAETFVISIKTIHKASKIDPHDPVQLQKLVGITDKETLKLMKVLNSRVVATEAAAKAKFPEIKTDTGKKNGENGWLRLVKMERRAPRHKRNVRPISKL